MKTNHQFGLYFTEAPIGTYVMDDFGNAVEMSVDMLIAFGCTSIADCTSDH